jgi:tRNA (guanine37-N1)-methyltransferase
VEASAERRTKRAQGLAVHRSQAEQARQTLLGSRILERGLTPLPDGDTVVFPLIEDAPPHIIEEAQARMPDSRLVEQEFPGRGPREADYRDRLRHLPQPLLGILPRAHDVIGEIALMKLPEPLLPHKLEIAQALLATHTRLRSVALDKGVKGEDRVRELEVLAGDDDLQVMHREHGLRLHVDIDKVYFSPRLATEREELLKRIKGHQRIVDLFAGIGAFVCLLLRERDVQAVCAIDQNPHAVRLLKKNLQTNRLPTQRVEVLEGDAREHAPRTGDWDHVVMNLPHDAHHFLDVAAECVAPQGEIHLYAILDRDDEDEYVRNALQVLQAHTGQPWAVAERRHVRQYAPTMDGIRYSLHRAPA